MNVDELRPRQVIDEEDQVASTSSQSNEQAINFQYSNQPILQEIIHWTL